MGVRGPTGVFGSQAARDSTQLDPVLLVEAPEEVPGFVRAELADKAKWHPSLPIMSSKPVGVLE